MDELFSDIDVDINKKKMLTFDRDSIKSVMSEIKISDILKISISVIIGSTIGTAMGTLVSTAVKELIVPKEVKILRLFKNILKI